MNGLVWTICFLLQSDALLPLPAAPAPGVIYRYDIQQRRLQELSAEQLQGGVSLFQFGSVRVRVKSARSTQRSTDVSPTFIVNVPTNENPARYHLFKMSSKRNVRETRYLVSEDSVLSPKRRFHPGDRLAITIEGLRDRVFAIKPAVALAPGEYCFVMEGKRTAYCLGVD